jgi:hypothetical protein
LALSKSACTRVPVVPDLVKNTFDNKPSADHLVTRPGSGSVEGQF